MSYLRPMPDPDDPSIQIPSSRLFKLEATCLRAMADRDAALAQVAALTTRVEELTAAVESAYCAVKPDGCDCGADEPGTCALCLIEALREKGWVA